MSSEHDHPCAHRQPETWQRQSLQGLRASNAKLDRLYSTGQYSSGWLSFCGEGIHKGLRFHLGAARSDVNFVTLPQRIEAFHG